MKKTISKEIANNIREIRKAKGIKQTELAAAIGTTQGRVAEYETGKLKPENITIGVALKIAQALDSTIEDLFVKTIETTESKFKFGIFEASCELRTFERAWDFMENDTEIDAPLEIFETEAEAVEALRKYRSDVTRFRSNGGYYLYTGKVYFVAELIVYDEVAEDDTDKSIYTAGDGVAITEIEDKEEN